MPLTHEKDSNSDDGCLSERDRAVKACDPHLNSETRHVCLRHDITMRENWLRYQDPEIYCTHRSAWAIHFLTRRKGSRQDVLPCRKPPA
jgi:hypothetical protein